MCGIGSLKCLLNLPCQSIFQEMLHEDISVQSNQIKLWILELLAAVLEAVSMNFDAKHPQNPITHRHSVFWCFIIYKFLCFPNIIKGSYNVSTVLIINNKPTLLRYVTTCGFAEV
jgi:hypothetical protein